MSKLRFQAAFDRQIADETNGACGRKLGIVRFIDEVTVQDGRFSRIFYSEICADFGETND